MSWKLEGVISREEMNVGRKQRQSKYDLVVSALVQAKPGVAIILNLDDEQNPKGAAQRIAVAVRKCAVGKIEGKIRSRFDLAQKKIYLWEADEEGDEDSDEDETEATETASAKSKKATANGAGKGKKGKASKGHEATA